MFEGEIEKKNFPLKKILSQISSALFFLFVSDLSMLSITKLSI